MSDFTTLQVELVIDGDADGVEGILDEMLDDGELQDLLAERLEDRDITATIQKASCCQQLTELKPVDFVSVHELPETLTSGPRDEYAATLEEITQAKFAGDNQVGARWKICRNGKRIGAMIDGPRSGYGWGRPRYSLRELVWDGPFPTGYPKNPEGALTFDSGPIDDGYQSALVQAAKQADALIAWRQVHAPGSLCHDCGSELIWQHDRLIADCRYCRRCARKNGQMPEIRIDLDEAIELLGLASVLKIWKRRK